MKKFLIILAFPLLLLSCSDFLEPESQDQYIPSDVEHLNELIIDALSDLNSDNLSGLLEIVSDNLKTALYYKPSATQSYYTSATVRGSREIYTWQPDYSERMRAMNLGYFDMYSVGYNRLARVNTIMDYLHKVSGSDTDRDWVEAQARVLRGFYYLQLVNIYGEPYQANKEGLGVPLRTTANKEDVDLARKTVGQVYAQIETDLLRAVELFEDQVANRKYRQHRPTLPLALHLLSRMYLYMEEWEKSAEYAEKLIREWPNFRLKNLAEVIDAGYTNVHYWDYTASGNGTSAQRQCLQSHYNFLSYDNSDVIWLYNSANVFFELTGHHYNPGGPTRNFTYQSLFLTSDSLIESFEEEDLRLRTYFVRHTGTEPVYTRLDTSPRTEPKEYKAYGKCDILNSGNTPSTSNMYVPAGTNAFGQSMRLSETYLNLAEAKAMIYLNGGDGAAAQASLDAINTLRRNRFRAYTDWTLSDFSTPQALVDSVLKERRRELCLEGLRWFDLRRTGMPEITHVWYNISDGSEEVYTLGKNDPSYTFAIPVNVIENNDYLVQPPLYNGGAERTPTRVTPAK